MSARQSTTDQNPPLNALSTPGKSAQRPTATPGGAMEQAPAARAPSTQRESSASTARSARSRPWRRASGVGTNTGTSTGATGTTTNISTGTRNTTNTINRLQQGKTPVTLRTSPLTGFTRTSAPAVILAAAASVAADAIDTKEHGDATISIKRAVDQEREVRQHQLQAIQEKLDKLACRVLAIEHNHEHAHNAPGQPSRSKEKPLNAPEMLRRDIESLNSNVANMRQHLIDLESRLEDHLYSSSKHSVLRPFHILRSLKPGQSLRQGLLHIDSSDPTKPQPAIHVEVPWPFIRLSTQQKQQRVLLVPALLGSKPTVGSGGDDGDGAAAAPVVNVTGPPPAAAVTVAAELTANKLSA